MVSDSKQKFSLDQAMFDPQCSVRQTLDIISNKWTALVIHTLSHGTFRYNELRRVLKGISHKMLAQTLHELEEYGLVKRQVFPEVPPRVEYSLTPSGKTLIEPLSTLVQWAEENPLTSTTSSCKQKDADTTPL